MALCCWPCNCYRKGDRKEPDLMWEADLYARLDLADAWAIIGPINWYAPSSNLKLMFDRLVCMNGGNPREELIAHKDPEKALALEHRREWKELSLNHLEGRTAAFFVYGDGGADEIGTDGRPKILRHKEYFDPARQIFDDDQRQCFAPLVWQCRYGGIEVPDELWRFGEFGVGVPYSENQAEALAADTKTLAIFDEWVEAFAVFVAAKGAVQPGKYRAFGYKPPGHFWADVRLKWRELRMGMGYPRRRSSPAHQQALGLNRDTTLRPKKTEGEKLRRE